MARGINKVIFNDEDQYILYMGGMSIPEVSEATGIPKSTLRFRFKARGILRSRKDGTINAAKNGRLGSGLRGKTRNFSESHIQSIKDGRRRWGEENARGVSVKQNGYVQFTKGPHKGRSVHVVKMEERVGRKLNADEVVHHIDGNRQNNDENNLSLCTRAGHTRLHRYEDRLAGIERRRESNGTWS